MDINEYKKKWKQSNSLIVNTSVKEWNNWSYSVQIEFSDGGSNGIAKFYYDTNSPEEKKLAFELAQKYAQKIKKAQAGIR